MEICEGPDDREHEPCCHDSWTCPACLAYDQGRRDAEQEINNLKAEVANLTRMLGEANKEAENNANAIRD